MNKLNYSKALLVLILCILIVGNSFSTTSVKQNSKQLIVVIDPGHGGKDPGAVSKTVREKDVVLGIGLKLGKLINENYPDVKVVFTRNTDVFIPLIDRSRIANKCKADLFISLHANFCATPSTRGTETFTLGLHRSNDNLEVAKKENSVILMEDDYKTTYEDFDPNLSESYIMFEMMQDLYMDQSLSFADAIQHQFKSRIESSNRGVKQAGFLVLRQSSMPSVLVETGFISNKDEANYLSSEDGQRNIALSIFEAFKKFKSKNSGTANKKATEEIAIQPKPEKIETKPEPAEAKPEVGSENQIAENKKEKEIIPTSVVPEKPAIKKDEPLSTTDTVKTNLPGNAVYYTIQIAASTTPAEAISANFKGVKDIRRDKIDKYYRYYVGNESSADSLASLLQQIRLKFPQAFVVSFVNGKRVLLK
jgi:N-acetylmuramoyl-L-alanine amidase